MKTDKSIYLDYAAATPLDSRVLEAMLPYFADDFYNPSSPYEPARKVRRDIDAAREKIAHILGARPSEIIFTAGATESINLAFAQTVRKENSSIVSAVEHDAVLRTAQQGHYCIAPVTEKGTVKLDDLEAMITDTTQIISIGLVNNEVGTIQSLPKVATIIEKIRQSRLEVDNHTPLYLHTDASQAAGMLDIHTARLGVDLLTLNAAKVYGPKQVGLLWVRAGIRLSPLLCGGGQEQGLRSGTENVAGIIGFAKALEIAEGQRKQEVARLGKLRDLMQSRLCAEFKQCIIAGNQKHRVAHILHISFPGLDAERLLFALESRGVYVATGAACAASKQESSHVLRAIGMNEEEMRGSLRLSVGRYTTEEEVDRGISQIIEVVQKEYLRVATS